MSLRSPACAALPFLVLAGLKSRENRNINDLSVDPKSHGYFPRSGKPWANNTGNFQLSQFHLASQTLLLSSQLNSDAIHSEFSSQEQHQQNWQRSCSSYSTLPMHLHLPHAIIQHAHSIAGWLTPTSLAPGLRAPEPQITQKRSSSHPIHSALGSLVFLFLLQEAGSGNFQLQVLREYVPQSNASVWED